MYHSEAGLGAVTLNTDSTSDLQGGPRKSWLFKGQGGPQQMVVLFQAAASLSSGSVFCPVRFYSSSNPQRVKI